MPLYNFGYDPLTQQFVLHKAGRKTEVCRIPLDCALPMIETLIHVVNNEAERAAR